MPPGRRHGIKEQSPLIKTIVRQAIEILTDDVLCKNSWPEEATNRIDYGKTVILAACEEKTSMSNFTDIIKEFKSRLSIDKKFAKGLCDMVCPYADEIRLGRLT